MGSALNGEPLQNVKMSVWRVANAVTTVTILNSTPVTYNRARTVSNNDEDSLPGHVDDYHDVYVLLQIILAKFFDETFSLTP